MGICWHCYWGWPKQVADIYRKYEALSSESAMMYGCAHIVWSDENFDDDSILWCLREDGGQKYNYDDPDYAQYVNESLRELLKVPEEIRVPPKDYDSENPENFPPPPGMVMERIS